LIFSKQVNILDAVVAVLLMEASLNGCGKLLDKINALHTTFSLQPEQEYEDHGIKIDVFRNNNIFYFYSSSSRSRLA
jgi:hypothetical protein